MSRDALIVGINSYQNLPNLTASAQDAEAVARCLESFGEFRVNRLPEIIQAGKPMIGDRVGVSTRMLENALIKLFKPTGKNIPYTAVFYYSGHGWQREAGIREGYLATSDADPKGSNYGLSLFWLRRLLQESPVRQRVIILDCCHSGELLNFLEADPGAREGTDRLFMAAAREYESAYESFTSTHSVFTEALLSGLNPYQVKGGIVDDHHLIATVNHRLKGEIQQPLFESSGSNIILTRASGASAQVTIPESTTLERLRQYSYTFCPYRGLEPFDTPHADYFFGREELTAQLFQQVRTSRVCTVLGASGSGKTSLLKAGLMDRLQRQNSSLANGDSSWAVHYMTPGAAPFKRLAEIFIQPDAQNLERADQLRRAEAFLENGERGLAQLLQAVTQAEQPEGSNDQPFVLVIDQFEDLLTTVPTADVAVSPTDSGNHPGYRFIAALTAAIQDPQLSLHLVIGLRSDRLEALRTFPNFYSLIAEQVIEVSPMTYDQVKSTIVGPLDKMGLQYDTNLIYTLLLDVVGTPGELALLQLALKELWRRRQVDPQQVEAPKLLLEAYTELGGVRNLLNERATSLYHGLSEQEQVAAKRIFLGLCELGEGTQDSARRATISEFITPDLSEAFIQNVLNKLVAANLVVVDRPMGEFAPRDYSPKQDGITLPTLAWQPKTLKQASSLTSVLQAEQPSDDPQSQIPSTLEIIHESLIRTWPLLRGWLDAEREPLRHQRRLETAALEWQRSGCPTHPEYLLVRSRLQEAEEFQQSHGYLLSTLAQQYIQTSQRQARRQLWQKRALRSLIPISLLAGMLAAYEHHQLLQRWNQPSNSHQITPTLSQESAHRPIATDENSWQGRSLKPGETPWLQQAKATAIPDQAEAADASLSRQAAEIALQNTHHQSQQTSDTSQLAANSDAAVASLTKIMPLASEAAAQLWRGVDQHLAQADWPQTTAQVGSSPQGLSLKAIATHSLSISDNAKMHFLGKWPSSENPEAMVEVWCVQPPGTETCFLLNPGITIPGFPDDHDSRAYIAGAGPT